MSCQFLTKKFGTIFAVLGGSGDFAQTKKPKNISIMNFSKYQLDIFHAVKNSSKNIVVNAVAGSGKTFTIVNACKQLAMPKQDILFLAFNKSIVDELSVKIGAYAEVRTCHSFGMSALYKAFGGRKPIVKQDKWRNIAQNRFGAVYGDDLTPSVLAQTMSLFDKCRLDLIQKGQYDKIYAIADHHGIILEGDFVADMVSELLGDAYKLPIDNCIDFTDMLTLSVTACKRYVPKYRIVFIDECQDLDTSKRELMLLASKGGRFVAVGDPKQAINGFAGADCDSFGKLVSLPNTIELPLSVNYRCGSDIIKLAQDIVPHITAHEGAICGQVVTANDLTKDLFGRNAMVLCRKNAPLVSTALKCIANGITATIKGKDIAKGLENLIKKVGGKTQSLTTLANKFDSYVERETAKVAKKHGITKDMAEQLPTIVGLKDKIACIDAVMAYYNPTSVNQLIESIDQLFSDYRMNDAVTFSTIHKAKGLEADKVVILCPDKLPLMWKGQLDWQLEQELNLKYVAITRAKRQLTILNMSESELLKSKLK